MSWEGWLVRLILMIPWCEFTDERVFDLHRISSSSQGTVQMTYSYVHRDTSGSESQLSSSDVFHTRQIIYPVHVTVYHTLEFSNLDIIPLFSHHSNSTSPNSHDLTRSLLDVPSHDGDYCLVSVDVSNLYGQPFHVTLERHQEGILANVM